jgi:flagellar motor switch protein FliM
LNILKDKLVTVDVNVVAEIGKINIPVRDVLALRIGDMVRLNTVKVGDPFTLSIGGGKKNPGKTKFFCKPGIGGKKMAIQITQKLGDIDAGDLEEFGEAGEGFL